MTTNISENNLEYRLCVGVALFNRNGNVLIGKRTIDDGSWAMPQSGINDDETVMMATRRELASALGITDVRMLTIAPEWLKFDYPTYLVPKVHNGQFCGQKQKWVAAQYLGNDDDINLNAGDKQEFSLWRWEELSNTSGVVVPYKRQVYRNVYEMFERYTNPIIPEHHEMAMTSMETTSRITEQELPNENDDNIIQLYPNQYRREAS